MIMIGTVTDPKSVRIILEIKLAPPIIKRIIADFF